MQLFTHQIAAILPAHNFRNLSNTFTAADATKRTAWYPAFGEMVTWSPIG